MQLTKKQFVEQVAKECAAILDFWKNNTVDNENGGFIGAIDFNGVKQPLAEKGAVLNARILWAYSSAYRIFKNPDYLTLATREFEYLKNHFVDKQYSGVYWMLDYKGNPANTRKQIYAIAFAIYGLAEYNRATGNKEALDIAIQLFHSIEDHSFDPIDNGYFEAYSRDWKLLEDLRLSEKDANDPKTMNTHLHILEAYTCLYRVWKDDLLKKQLKNLIEVFLNQIIDQKNGFFNLFFGPKWEHRSQENSYGHDIEGSWLLWEAAEVLDDSNIKQLCKPVCISMAEQSLKYGLDTDGGMMSDGLFGVLKDTDKHWWPQAETIVGMANAYQLTGDEKFWNASLLCWDFTNKYIIDHQNGEWFWRVEKDSHKPYSQEQKTGPWKCPYHNSRMCMEIYERFN